MNCRMKSSNLAVAEHISLSCSVMSSLCRGASEQSTNGTIAVKVEMAWNVTCVCKHVRACDEERIYIKHGIKSKY